MKPLDYFTARRVPKFEIGDRVRVKGSDIIYVIEEIPEDNLYNSKTLNSDGLIFSFYGSEIEKV